MMLSSRPGKANTNPASPPATTTTASSTSPPALLKIRKRRVSAAGAGKRGQNHTTHTLRLVQCFVVTVGILAFGSVVWMAEYSKKSTTKTTPLQENIHPQLPSSSSSSSSSSSEEQFSSPLLIFTCRRANYLNETLSDILRYLPKHYGKQTSSSSSSSTYCAMGCPIVVSQDGTDESVRRVVLYYQEEFQKQHNIPVIHLQHQSSQLRGNAYQALAVHYGWALHQVFGTNRDGEESKNSLIPTQYTKAAQRVVILEEDLHIAPDFFDYFYATRALLDADATLLAVSAFNDNGYAGTVKEASRVVRSDFFPGLGWMMTRRLWTQELADKWPNGYWDDWLREPAQRQNRHILRPEISRTFHFGIQGGASGNQFGGHLSQILLNPNPVDWKQQQERLEEDLSESVFDQKYWNLVTNAALVSSVEAALEQVKTRDVRLEYATFAAFKMLANQLHLMDDEKAGIPRTAYKGIVETRPLGNYFLFVTPSLEELKKSFAAVQ